MDTAPVRPWVQGPDMNSHTHTCRASATPILQGSSHCPISFPSSTDVQKLQSTEAKILTMSWARLSLETSWGRLCWQQGAVSPATAQMEALGMNAEVRVFFHSINPNTWVGTTGHTPFIGSPPWSTATLVWEDTAPRRLPPLRIWMTPVSNKGGQTLLSVYITFQGFFLFHKQLSETYLYLLGLNKNKTTTQTQVKTRAQ